MKNNGPRILPLSTPDVSGDHIQAAPSVYTLLREMLNTDILESRKKDDLLTF